MNISFSTLIFKDSTKTIEGTNKDVATGVLCFPFCVFAKDKKIHPERKNVKTTMLHTTKSKTTTLSTTTNLLSSLTFEMDQNPKTPKSNIEKYVPSTQVLKTRHFVKGKIVKIEKLRPSGHRGPSKRISGKKRKLATRLFQREKNVLASLNSTSRPYITTKVKTAVSVTKTPKLKTELTSISSNAYNTSESPKGENESVHATTLLSKPAELQSNNNGTFINVQSNHAGATHAANLLLILLMQIIQIMPTIR